MKHNALDMSGRELHEGDSVFAINEDDRAASASLVGEITGIESNDLVVVCIDGEFFKCKTSQISKINVDEPLDDIIAHLSHDVEQLQLIKEAEILNKMLGEDE